MLNKINSIDLITLKTGNIILLNRHGDAQSWYSVCQRFFTRKPYTHTALLFGLIKDIKSVLSADEIVDILPLQNYLNEKGTDIEIWGFKNDHLDKIDPILKSLYSNYANMSYGYLQIPWYVYRWLMEVVFKKDVRKQKNWSTTGVVCSELTYIYLYNFCDEYPQLKKKLDEWNKDTVSAGDIADIIHLFPEIFELKYQRIEK